MTYAVHAFRGIMIKGTGLLFLLPDVLIVGVFAILTQLLGNVMFYFVLTGRKSKSKEKKNQRKKTTT